MGQREAKQKSTQSPQQFQQNQRRQTAMSQQQAFKRKLEARNKAEQDFDDALWELSQREEEILADMKKKELQREAMKLEVSQVESMQWDDEEDLGTIASYL